MTAGPCGSILNVNNTKATQNWGCSTVAYHWWQRPQVSFLSWQKFRHDKVTKLVMTNVCHDKSYVATKMCFSVTNTGLSWQKWYMWQLPPMTVMDSSAQYYSVMLHTALMFALPNWKYVFVSFQLSCHLQCWNIARMQHQTITCSMTIFCSLCSFCSVT